MKMKLFDCWNSTCRDQFTQPTKVLQENGIFEKVRWNIRFGSVCLTFNR